MIGKITRGKTFSGLIKYVLEKEKANLLGGNTAAIDAAGLAREYEAVAALRPSIGKPVHHVSLSLPAGEKILPEAWEKIVPAYMEKMGIDPANHQYFYAAHGDTKFDHVHIVINRIGLDGKPFSDSLEKYRNKDACRALEKEYFLTAIPNEKKPYAPKYSQGERRFLQRTGAVDDKSSVNEKIKSALAGKPSIQEFAAALAADGVGVMPNIATTGKISGFSFTHEGKKYTGSGVGFAWKYLEPKIQPLTDDDFSFLRGLKEGKNPAPKKRPRDPGAYNDAWRAFNAAVFATATGKASGMKEALAAKGFQLDGDAMEKDGRRFEMAAFGFTAEMENELYDLRLMNEKTREKSKKEVTALVKKYHGKGFDVIGKIEGETLLLLLGCAPQIFFAVILFQIAANAIAEAGKPASEEALKASIQAIYEKNGARMKEEMNAFHAAMKEERRARKEAMRAERESLTSDIKTVQQSDIRIVHQSDNSEITQSVQNSVRQHSPAEKKVIHNENITQSESTIVKQSASKTINQNNKPSITQPEMRLQRGLNIIFYNDRRFLQMEKEGLAPAKIAAKLFREFIPKDAAETLQRAGWPKEAVSAACKGELKAIDLEDILIGDIQI